MNIPLPQSPTSTPSSVGAGSIYFEDFNSYTGIQNANEIGTGLKLSAFGDLVGWTKGGFNAVHAVDLGGGNYAPMLYMNNTLTLNTGFAGNAAGWQYRVSLDAAPTLYSGLNEATTASDGLIISLIRGDNSVLASQPILPGAWIGGANGQALSQFSFNYLGDGSGNLRFVISTINSSAGRFGGAIDNLSVSAIPEPATLALVVLALSLVVGAVGLRRSQALKARQNLPADD